MKRQDKIRAAGGLEQIGRTVALDQNVRVIVTSHAMKTAKVGVRFQPATKFVHQPKPEKFQVPTFKTPLFARLEIASLSVLGTFTPPAA